MLISLILSIFPSFLGVPLRRLLGQKIGRGTKIRFGTLIKSKSLEICDKCSIGPFSVLIANELIIGSNVKIKPLSITKANKIKISDNSQISPLAITNGPLIAGADLIIGKHSQIFPFCWLEPGEGIYLGNHVGVGGHSFIFTHGSWSNYINGGPVSFGPVTIEDNVWLPWRVFILPNVTIGKNAIIAAHSVVSKSIEANSLAAGNPAKVVKENFIKVLSEEEKSTKLKEILQAYEKFNDRVNYQSSLSFSIDQTNDKTSNNKFAIFLNTPNSREKDYLDLVKLEYNSNSIEVGRFVEFLRKYGLRVARV